jgi:hypothetical protein
MTKKNLNKVHRNKETPNLKQAEFGSSIKNYVARG